MKHLNRKAMISPEKIREYQEETSTSSPADLLHWTIQKFPEGLVFTSSFSAEDMVILHLIHTLKLPIEIITLDTGRLPEETYELMEQVKLRYNLPIKVCFPNTTQIEKLVSEKGFFSFRMSIENRKECCRLRKIEPLKRALHGKKIWITGIRQGQSITREVARKVEYDASFNVIKINPLLDWSEEEIWDFIKKNDVPFNRLHTQGYPSIGCAPCTRAIKPGEDIRAGRWWWETPEQKECGLHGYCNKDN